MHEKFVHFGFRIVVRGDRHALGEGIVRRLDRERGSPLHLLGRSVRTLQDLASGNTVRTLGNSLVRAEEIKHEKHEEGTSGSH